MEESRRMSEWMQAVMGSDQSLIGEVLRLGLEALMEAERDLYVNAEPYERGEGRRTYRNGYKVRQKRTRVGTLTLRVPQTRDGGFYPSVLSKYQRSEGALISTLAECYLQGVSTRKVSRICEELFGEGISHETVSRYTQELDEGLSAWRERRLDEEAFPYVIVDARYEKARVDGRVVDVAVLIAVGVSESGKRHLLGVEVAHGETRASWSAFFAGLLERGLRGVELLVSDAHAGLADARRRHFPGTPWQRCQRHFLMNALEKAPKALEDMLHERLRRIWDESSDLKEARAGFGKLARDLEGRSPELAEWLEQAGEDTLAVFHFPAEHRKRLRTTNGNERINQELLRRTRVVRIFPNTSSLLRLTSALLKEWHEDWVTGRRYLDMTLLEEQEAAGAIAA